MTSAGRSSAKILMIDELTLGTPACLNPVLTLKEVISKERITATHHVGRRLEF